MKAKKRKIIVGAGAGVLTAAALAAAGAYLLSDKKRRSKAKAWAAKAQKDVLRNLRAARTMSEKDYGYLVDKATKHYAAIHDVNAPELRKVASDMKAEWKRLSRDAQRLQKMMGGKGMGTKPKRPARKKPARRTRRTSRSR